MFFRYNFYTAVWSLCMLFFTCLVRTDVTNHNLLPFLTFLEFTLFFNALILTFFSIVGLRKQQQVAYLKFNALQIGTIFSFCVVAVLEVVFFFFVNHSQVNVWEIVYHLSGCVAGTLFYKIIHKF